MPLDRNPHETAFLRRLEQQRRDRPPARGRTPGIRAMTDPLGVARRPPQPLWPYATAPKGTTPMPTVTAKSLKVVAVIDAAEIARISAPEGGPARIVLNVTLPDRMVAVDLAAKSVRKAKATIAELGADGTACIIQGRMLGNPDRIADAGLSAQPKAKKPESADPPAAQEAA
jgi:hypothetical protein